MLKSIREIVGDNRHYLPEKTDISGWNADHPIFQSLIERTSPKSIIEVGTWKGRSCLQWARLSNATIYCVDSWLGGIDHVFSDDPMCNLNLDKFGSPQIYEQFLRNFIDTPFCDRIFPVRQTTINGSRILNHLCVKADIIYIDAGHEYNDAYMDMCAYYGLLKEGGIMFGDDFRSFQGVFVAAQRFAHERNLKLSEIDGIYWIMEVE